MASECYKQCNYKYSAFDSSRIFCKKGCDSSDDTTLLCKKKTCNKVCVKEELGDENSKLGSWSKILGRAPKDPELCFTACFFGCNNKIYEADYD